MKTILVPTDFSENAMHALRYACMLNAALKGKVILFHSYAVPVFATEGSYAAVMPAEDELKDESVELLKKLKKKIESEFPNMEFETLMEEGYAESAITETARKKGCELLVMGTQGASGLREALIGSITAAVMEEADCPVIAVPDKTTVSRLDRIVFATDYALNDFENVSKVIELARPFGGEVILVHVSSGELDKAYEFASIENFKSKISGETHYDRISFKLLESHDVLNGLNFYLDEVRADMLAMSMHHRTFFQKLFNRGKTKWMAFHTHIPLLAFHAEN